MNRVEQIKAPLQQFTAALLFPAVQGNGHHSQNSKLLGGNGHTVQPVQHHQMVWREQEPHSKCLPQVLPGKVPGQVEQGNENNTVCTVVCIQEICCQRKGKNHQEFSDETEMMPSTGYLTVWDIREAEGGFLFVYPDTKNPDQVAKFLESPNFFRVFSEGERWGQLMECETVADLNDLTTSGRIRELIRINEALHEKRYSQIADMICQRGAKAVMLAGPSSSGKTTSANRLAIQLRVHGKKPILMSLDDYYIDRDQILPGPDGKLDLEHINTLDTALFRSDLTRILNGEEVELPSFNFKTGCREWRGHKLKLHPDSVIIVEGLHGLNPVMLPEQVDQNLIFKLYISPLLPLNLDYHNRIPTSYLRLLRRTVRDYETRGSSVQKTLSMWDSVRRGEERWIFPYQEEADVIFNSSTLYELAVLKKHIFPLLTAVEPEDECYDEVQNIVKILNYVIEADVDDEIPPTSLVREFIGGNSFYRENEKPAGWQAFLRYLCTFGL